MLDPYYHPSPPSKPLPAALRIAGKGKPIFPCKPDKAPYYEKDVLEHGCLDATTDPRKITAWWTRWSDAKIGMPTGRASGVFVVDVDRLEALGELPRELPETLTMRTPSGGLHYYFNHVPGITNKRGTLPAGIDIRGDGGYVIVPPSEGYTVERRVPITEAPDWLLEALRDEPRAHSGPGRCQTRTSIPDDGGPIHEGGRDETLTRIAGRLHDGTRDLSQLEDDLQSVNETRCIPPLPFGQVRKIARSVYRYEPCRPRRRYQDPETVAELGEIEDAILRREWKGQRGKTKYSIAVAALKIARQHGEKVEDGVRVTVSARQLALAAATSRMSIVRNIKDMDGVLRADNENVEPGKSGAIILLSPPAPLDTTLPTEGVIERDEGGCIKWRAPLTAARLRWSSPAYKPRRGLVKGSSKVRNAPLQEKRAAVIRLGKSCERVVDSMEAAGGAMTLDALAAAVDVKRARELTRRRNPETGKGRDGFVTRLENVGVLTVTDGTVTLASDWLEAVDRERERAGEIELYKRDMARYNRESKAYRTREKVQADRSPSEEELREQREGYPGRRREAIKAALARLFQEAPEYPGRRVGQITCRLMFYLPEDFPRGPDGVPKDAEVEAILDGEHAA